MAKKGFSPFSLGKWLAGVFAAFVSVLLFFGHNGTINVVLFFEGFIFGFLSAMVSDAVDEYKWW